MANTRFKTENGLLVIAEPGVNSDFFTVTNFNANVNVNASVWYLSGNLNVGGTLNFVNTTVTGTFVPNIDQVPLGNTTNRFNGFFYDVLVYDTLTPATSGLSFGNTTNRWAAFLSATDISRTLNVNGNVTINTLAFAVDSADVRAGVNTSIGSMTNTFNVTGQSLLSGNTFTVGIANITGNVISSGVLAGNTTLFANLATIANTSQLIIDSYPKTQAQCAKYVVFVNQTSSGDVHTIELLFAHDGTFVYLTKYGEVFTTNLGTFDAAINNANVEVYFTAGVANTYTVKSSRIQVN